MREIYLIIQIMDWYDGEKNESPLFTVGDEITARNDCKRMQKEAYEKRNNKLYRLLFKYEKIKFYEF